MGRRGLKNCINAVPFSQRQRSCDKRDFVCFYEHDIKLREILTILCVISIGSYRSSIFNIFNIAYRICLLIWMKKRCVDGSRKEVQILAIIYARREQAKRLNN